MSGPRVLVLPKAPRPAGPTARVLDAFVSLYKGLAITVKAFFTKRETIHFPRAQVDNIASWRGHVEQVGRDDNPAVARCIMCGMCVSVCPSQCLDLSFESRTEDLRAAVLLGATGCAPGQECPPSQMAGATAEGKAEGKAPPKPKKTKVLTGFTYKFHLCSLCGLCVQHCPVDSLAFSTNAYVVADAKEDCEYDLLARLREQAAARDGRRAASAGSPGTGASGASGASESSGPSTEGKERT